MIRKTEKEGKKTHMRIKAAVWQNNNNKRNTWKMFSSEFRVLTIKQSPPVDLKGGSEKVAAYSNTVGQFGITMDSDGDPEPRQNHIKICYSLAMLWPPRNKKDPSKVANFAIF